VRTIYHADDDILGIRVSAQPIVREDAQNWNTCISYAVDGSVVEIVILEASE